MRILHRESFDFSRIGRNAGGLCYVTVLVPETKNDGVPVVVVSEPEESECSNITGAAEYLAAEIQESYPVLRESAARCVHPFNPYVYIEHYPARVERAGTRHEVPLCETWSMLAFESYRPEEIALEGETRLRLGDAHWKYLPESWVRTLLSDKALSL